MLNHQIVLSDYHHLWISKANRSFYMSLARWGGSGGDQESSSGTRCHFLAIRRQPFLERLGMAGNNGGDMTETCGNHPFLAPFFDSFLVWSGLCGGIGPRVFTLHFTKQTQNNPESVDRTRAWRTSFGNRGCVHFEFVLFLSGHSSKILSVDGIQCVLYSIHFSIQLISILFGSVCFGSKYVEHFAVACHASGRRPSSSPLPLSTFRGWRRGGCLTRQRICGRKPNRIRHGRTMTLDVKFLDSKKNTGGRKWQTTGVFGFLVNPSNL